MNTSVETIEGMISGLLRRQLAASGAADNSQDVEIDSSTNLVSDLDLDSFAVMELLMEIEDHYDIAIDIGSLANVHTLRDLAGVVHARVME